MGHRILVIVSLIAVISACAPLRGPAGPLRLSQLADEGDPARRASMRLILQGLDADALGQPDQARVPYERALRVDPLNPYAYLAMARHLASGERPARALPYLDKAQTLFAAQGALSPGVEANLVGLRGAALRADGRFEEGAPLLERARQLEPSVWSDGALRADELR